MNNKTVMFTVEELYVMCMIIEWFVHDEGLIKTIVDYTDEEVRDNAALNMMVLNRLYNKFDKVLTDHNYDDLDEMQYMIHKHDCFDVDIVENIEDKVLLGVLDGLIANDALEKQGIDVCMNVISSLDVQDYD